MRSCERSKEILPTAPRKTVLIADDDPRVRGGLRALLEAGAEMALAGEARSAAELRQQVANLQPSVILLDLFLPGSDDILGLLQELAGERPVVAISVRGGLRTAALRAGA